MTEFPLVKANFLIFKSLNAFSDAFRQKFSPDTSGLSSLTCIVKASYGRLFRLNFQDLYAPFVVTATWRKNIFERRHFWLNDSQKKPCGIVLETGQRHFLHQIHSYKVVCIRIINVPQYLLCSPTGELPWYSSAKSSPTRLQMCVL